MLSRYVEIVERLIVRYKILELYSDANIYTDDGSKVNGEGYFKEECDATHPLKNNSCKDME